MKYTDDQELLELDEMSDNSLEESMDSDLLLEEFKEEEKVKSTVVRDLRKFIVPLILLSLFVSFMLNVILQFGYIGSSSMAPTLSDNVFAIGTRCPGVCEVKRGEIVIFNHENYDELLIKRVVGVGGDVVELTEEGKIRINGQDIYEDYINDETMTIPSHLFPDRDRYVVPKGALLLFGDNRTDSADSRAWANPFIKVSEVTSKLILSFDMSPDSRNMLEFHRK